MPPYTVGMQLACPHQDLRGTVAAIRRHPAGRWEVLINDFHRGPVWVAASLCETP